jgi:hypothetical protein
LKVTRDLKSTERIVKPIIAEDISSKRITHSNQNQNHRNYADYLPIENLSLNGNEVPLKSQQSVIYPVKSQSFSNSKYKNRNNQQPPSQQHPPYHQRQNNYGVINSQNHHQQQPIYNNNSNDQYTFSRSTFGMGSATAASSEYNSVSNNDDINNQPFNQRLNNNSNNIQSSHQDYRSNDINQHQHYNQHPHQHHHHQQQQQQQQQHHQQPSYLDMIPQNQNQNQPLPQRIYKN